MNEVISSLMERLDGTTIIRSYVVRIFAELFLQPGFENEDVNMTMNMRAQT